MNELTRLGLSTHDRALVLHADDVGVCEASVASYVQLSGMGALSSASTMVPCGWFPAVAKACRADEARDMGVHLTLTSEWEHCRWRPLLGERAVALCDDDGYFPATSEAVQHGSDRDQLYAELRAQVARALAMGIDVTHVDTHMLSLLHPQLFGSYLRAAAEFDVPCVAVPFGAPWLAQLREGSRPEQLVLFDGWAELPLQDASHRLETAKRLLANLPRGLSYFCCHPAVDSRELRAMARDWEARVADHDLFLDERWMTAVESEGIEIVGMRRIRDRLRERSGRSRAPSASVE